MKWIDTHTHTWGHNRPELPWNAEVLPPEWDGPYTHDELIADMDRAGVTEGVIVTTPLYGRGPRANEYTMRSIEAHSDRLYGVGLLDFFPDDLAEAVDHVERVTGHERMLGVRMHAALEYEEHPSTIDRHGDWISDERLEAVWRAAGDLETSVFVFPKAQQLDQVAALAERYPETSIVVDHMAWPDETTAPNESPWTTFEALAEHENVAVKVSSIPRSAAEPWPYESVHGYVENLLEWFGPERLMLGSDYPWMDSWADYESCLSWIETVETLSRRDLAFLTHRTFERIHG
ncbi:amidohydrolase family protein [Natronolimnobius sp. AArcel1]|uniref:amidohydrolase family protein n=1 Tax=Natronolimnobius sp. AArcel1 TaxID=1679093 RepID=UPI0013EC0962|nr:amidohydrolase family protein [Natronolimnobius sp. AArcel1]NGM70509.1 amidohydrolase family protein [Natronolimnobius sp. AArcel1]